MPTFFNAVSAAAHILGLAPFPLALRSPFGKASAAAITPPAALSKQIEQCLLTLRHWFIKILARFFSLVNTFFKFFRFFLQGRQSSMLQRIRLLTRRRLPQDSGQSESEPPYLFRTLRQVPQRGFFRKSHAFLCRTDIRSTTYFQQFREWECSSFPPF